MKIQNEPITLPLNVDSTILTQLRSHADILEMCSQSDFYSFIKIADLQCCDDTGNSPLHVVFEPKIEFLANDIKFRTDVITYIIEKQKFFYVQNKVGDTPLHVIIKNTQYYIKKLSSDPQSKSLRELIQANTQFIKEILEKTPQMQRKDFINWTNLAGESALKYLEHSTNSDELSIYNLLLDETQKTYQVRTNDPIFNDIKSHADLLGFLNPTEYFDRLKSSDMQSIDSLGNSPLHLIFDPKIEFLENNIKVRIEIISYIMEKQNLRLQNYAGDTLLHAIIKNTVHFIGKLSNDRDSELLGEIVQSNMKFIEDLLKKIPDTHRKDFINCRNTAGESAIKHLEHCTEPDEMTLYCLLVNQGGDIYQDAKGNTLLHYYGQYNQHERIEDLFGGLVDAKVKLKFLGIENHQGKTASKIAAEKGSLESVGILRAERLKAAEDSFRGSLSNSSDTESEKEDLAEDFYPHHQQRCSGCSII